MLHDIERIEDELAFDLADAHLKGMQSCVSRAQIALVNWKRMNRRGRPTENLRAEYVAAMALLRQRLVDVDASLSRFFLERDLPVYENEEGDASFAPAPVDVVNELSVHELCQLRNVGGGHAVVNLVENVAESGDPLPADSVVVPASLILSKDAGELGNHSKCFDTCTHGNVVDDDFDALKDGVGVHDSSSLVGGCARRCAQGCGGSQPTGEESSREGSEQ